MRPRVGFLARRADDLGRALVAVGACAADPRRAGVGREPLRIAYWDVAGPVGPSAAVRRGVAEAVERLRVAGVAVERIDGALSVDAAWVHLGILSADGGADIRRLFAGERPMPELARLLRLAGLPRPLRVPLAGLARILGRRIEADALLATGPRRRPAFDALLALRADVVARVAAVAARHDAVVCPVSALPALRHGTAARLVVAAAPCLLASLLDLPAGAVPVTRVRHDEEEGRSASFDPVLRLAAAADRGSSGLPVGVQVVGLDTEPGRGEAVVLEVMRLIERGGVT